LTIFSGLRRLVGALEELGRALERLARAQEEVGPALERLDALELSRHKFEAMMEGLYLKAEGKLKAASNAEARERQLKRSYESQLDTLDPDSEIGPESTPVRAVDVAAGETEGVRPMRLDVATSNKAQRLRAKFGL